MAILFSGREMLEVALVIEKTGETFYTTLAQKAQQPLSRAAYDFLAVQERHHFQAFKKMLDSLGEPPAPEAYAGEHAAYVQSLARDRVFPDDQVAREMATKATDLEAINIALGAERDSLLFYWEMRGLVRQVDQAVVDRVMDEERSHVQRLTELKKKALEQQGGA